MKKKGGVREGAGRKKIGPEERILRARVAPHHEQALLLAGNGNLSEGIRRLADKHWRLINGTLKADGEPSQPSYSVHHRHRAFVRSGEGTPGVSGGGTQEHKSPVDEAVRGDGAGQAGDLRLQPPGLHDLVKRFAGSSGAGGEISVDVGSSTSTDRNLQD